MTRRAPTCMSLLTIERKATVSRPSTDSADPYNVSGQKTDEVYTARWSAAGELLGVSWTWIRQPRLRRRLSHVGTNVITDTSGENFAERGHLCVADRGF